MCPLYVTDCSAACRYWLVSILSLLMHESSGMRAPFAAYVPTYERSQYTRSGTCFEAMSVRNCCSLNPPFGAFTFAGAMAFCAMAKRFFATSSPFVPNPMMFSVPENFVDFVDFECAAAAVTAIAATTKATASAPIAFHLRDMHPSLCHGARAPGVTGVWQRHHIYVGT